MVLGHIVNSQVQLSTGMCCCGCVAVWPDSCRVLGMQTWYLMLSMGDVAGAEVMFDRAAGRPQVILA